jgi:SAM-dependent methyltransferase
MAERGGARAQGGRRLAGVVRKVLPPAARVRLRRLMRLQRLVLRPRWGNLRRRRPFSEHFGNDRGTPVDRIYIARFLAEHAVDVRGHVLEVGDSGYTGRYGGSVVARSDVLDIDPGNRAATIVADLAQPDSLPSDRFDCFLLIQTLQYVADVQAALRNAWKSLRPGGVLLVCVPGISRLDPDPGPAHDLHRFTPAGLAATLRATLPAAEQHTVGYGNLLTAVAFLYGIAAEELRPEELAAYDPHYPVLAAARVVRPAGPVRQGPP